LPALLHFFTDCFFKERVRQQTYYIVRALNDVVECSAILLSLRHNSLPLLIQPWRTRSHGYFFLKSPRLSARSSTSLRTLEITPPFGNEKRLDTLLADECTTAPAT